jgi:quercetin dioxygenase-like cupin family protein
MAAERPAMTQFKKSIAAHVQDIPEKGFKATLFRSERVLVGVNALREGGVQASHRHVGQDKFYVVQKGVGRFTVGDETTEGRVGDVVWAPADVPHGVENVGREPLVLLIAITPAPPEKTAI